MKRLVSVLVLAAVLLLQTVPASRNAGPTRWEGYPSSSVLAVEPGTPIRVDSERLVFDFSVNDDPVTKKDYDVGWVIGGRVTASYDMANPTDRMQRVQMAFPFIGSLASLSTQNIEVYAGEKAVPFGIYPGRAVESDHDYYGNDGSAGKVVFDFDAILADISDDAFVSRHFTKSEQGTLYTVTVTPASDQPVYFALDYEKDAAKTNVIATGFSGHEWRAENVRNSKWCYGTETFELFVLGEPIDIRDSAFLDGEQTKQTDAYSMEVETDHMSVYAYIVERLAKSMLAGRDQEQAAGALKLSDMQMYNVYAREIDRRFAASDGFASNFDLSDAWHVDRILTLLYSVDFPADSTQRVSVSYKAFGSMNMRETSRPMYSFDYIFNPANRWHSFKDLTISVIPPKIAPFLIKSNAAFDREEDGTYTAYFESLPDEDLTFTLYERADISVIEKVKGALFREFGYLYPFILIMGAAIIAFLALVIAIVHRVRKKRKA